MSAKYPGHLVERSRQQRGIVRKNESRQSARYSQQETKTIRWSRPTSSISKTSQCSSTVDARRWEKKKRQTQEDTAGHATWWPTSDGCQLGGGQVCHWWPQGVEIAHHPVFQREQQDLSLIKQVLTAVSGNAFLLPHVRRRDERPNHEINNSDQQYHQQNQLRLQITHTHTANEPVYRSTSPWAVMFSRTLCSKLKPTTLLSRARLFDLEAPQGRDQVLDHWL